MKKCCLRIVLKFVALYVSLSFLGCYTTAPLIIGRTQEQYDKELFIGHKTDQYKNSGFSEESAKERAESEYNARFGDIERLANKVNTYDSGNPMILFPDSQHGYYNSEELETYLEKRKKELEARNEHIEAFEAQKKLFKKAEQGDAEAQYKLGWMYEKGQDLPIDKIEAYKWFSLSVYYGHQEATEWLEALDRKLSRFQITEAKQRAATFIEHKKSTD